MRGAISQTRIYEELAKKSEIGIDYEGINKDSKEFGKCLTYIIFTNNTINRASLIYRGFLVNRAIHNTTSSFNFSKTNLPHFHSFPSLPSNPSSGL